jgi:hypothetical protein
VNGILLLCATEFFPVYDLLKSKYEGEFENGAETVAFKLVAFLEHFGEL